MRSFEVKNSMTSEGMEKIGLYDYVYIVTMIYTLSGILIREINVRNILITTMEKYRAKKTEID